MSTPRNRISLRAVRISVLAAALIGAACQGADSPLAPSADGFLSSGTAGRWTTSSPLAQGLDPAVLAEMEARIDGGEFGEVSSVLVLRNGILVYENYWRDMGPDDLHRCYSVTKSVASLLMGIADGDGSLPPLDTPVLESFPEYPTLANPEGKWDITLRHMLQMRAGLEWDELSTGYGEEANPLTSLIRSPDWIQFVLDLPFAATPGSRWAYNSGVSMLMAGVLEDRTGTSTEGFAAERLFAPLGITDWQWSTGSGDLINTGWGLRLRPRDMAAVGQMVLQRGAWDGRQIVPAVWIEQSAVAATRFTDDTGYGYQWWLDRPDSQGRPMAAWGWGGQFIVVVPSLDLVIISTAENFDGGGLDPYVLADFGYRAAGVTPP